MNELLEVKENENIENKIYQIRGKYVMLDSDLGEMYQCANRTKTINQAVKRNKERFPDDFCFQLTGVEYNNLKSQIGTTNNMSRSLPYAFTQEGVAMLASCLRTDVAKKVSVAIMRAFVKMKDIISNSLIEQKYINNLVLEDHEEIKLLKGAFEKFNNEELNLIYFEGQVYDSYSKILDIFKCAKNELIIIDRYADKSVLDMIKELEIKVILIKGDNSKLKDLDVEKYEKQYSNLKIIKNDSFHDRYFILDNDKVYHCGASINHAGSKTFSINILGDTDIIKKLIDKVNKIK